MSLDAEELTVPARDALTRICAIKRQEVAGLKAHVPVEALKAQIAARKDKPRGFGYALKSAQMRGQSGLITEFKRASPSGGAIRGGGNPAEVARAYVEGGAVCLSVLTEGPHFEGSIADLVEARAAVEIPVLRKDFILDQWQVYESRAIGADAILLIMAALTDAEAKELEELARALDLDVLVEVHDQAELERALGLQTPLIGINNRNLRTLKTDLETTLRLAPMVPPDRMVVAESGIKNFDDVGRLAAIGVQCLVGESLLRQPDLTAATKALLGQAA